MIQIEIDRRILSDDAGKTYRSVRCSISYTATGWNKTYREDFSVDADQLSKAEDGRVLAMAGEFANVMSSQIEREKGLASNMEFCDLWRLICPGPLAYILDERERMRNQLTAIRQRLGLKEGESIVAAVETIADVAESLLSPP